MKWLDAWRRYFHVMGTEHTKTLALVVIMARHGRSIAECDALLAQCSCEGKFE